MLAANGLQESIHDGFWWFLWLGKNCKLTPNLLQTFFKSIHFHLVISFMSIVVFVLTLGSSPADQLSGDTLTSKTASLTQANWCMYISERHVDFPNLFLRQRRTWKKGVYVSLLTFPYHTLRCVTLRYVTSRYVVLYYSTLHYIPLHNIRYHCIIA